MVAFEALLGQIYNKACRGTQAVQSDVALAALVASIETGQKDPGQTICQSPARGTALHKTANRAPRQSHPAPAAFFDARAFLIGGT
jgi:hypothetical protein